MEPVRVTSWYPKFNGRHFGLPPSSVHRMTGLGGNFVSTMTYAYMPHWHLRSATGHVYLCTSSPLNSVAQPLISGVTWLLAKMSARSMGQVWIRHSPHEIATQSSHFVDRAGWQAKMASIGFWILWRSAYWTHFSKKTTQQNWFSWRPTSFLTLTKWTKERDASSSDGKSCIMNEGKRRVIL